MSDDDQGSYKGLFYSSLDHQQTNRDQGRKEAVKLERKQYESTEFKSYCARMAYQVCPAEPSETLFRHSGWASTRRKVVEALEKINGGGSRLERFLACGAQAVVEYSPSLKRHRVRASYCGDRLCRPCAKARSVQAEHRFVKLAGDASLRFITLTLEHTDDPLSDQLDHLYASFTRLRQHDLWTDNVTGGVAVVEITFDQEELFWHVHLHILAAGRFIDQAELSDAWNRASRGSYIVDIRAVKEKREGIAYVAKDCSKGFHRSCADRPDDLLELALALRGRRMFATFGAWRNVDLEEEEDEATDWQKVGRVTSIIKAAGQGQAWALGILRSLRSEHVISDQVLLE